MHERFAPRDDGSLLFRQERERERETAMAVRLILKRISSGGYMLFILHARTLCDSSIMQGASGRMKMHDIESRKLILRIEFEF